MLVLECFRELINHLNFKDHQQNFQVAMGGWKATFMTFWRVGFGTRDHWITNFGGGVIKLDTKFLWSCGPADIGMFLLLQLVGWEYYLNLVGRVVTFSIWKKMSSFQDVKCGHMVIIPHVFLWFIWVGFEVSQDCGPWKLLRVHIPRPNICPSWGFFIIYIFFLRKGSPSPTGS